jgi:hypothetical protein
MNNPARYRVYGRPAQNKAINIWSWQLPPEKMPLTTASTSMDDNTSAAAAGLNPAAMRLAIFGFQPAPGRFTATLLLD